MTNQSHGPLVMPLRRKPGRYDRRANSMVGKEEAGTVGAGAATVGVAVVMAAAARGTTEMRCLQTLEADKGAGARAGARAGAGAGAGPATTAGDSA